MTLQDSPVRAARARSRSARELSADVTSGLLEAFPGYVALLDARGNIVAANQAWTRLYLEGGGKSVAVVGVGANYLEALRAATAQNGNDVACIAEAVDEALNGPESRTRIQISCTAPDGRQVILVAQRLPDTARGVIVTFVDVTEWASSARALQDAQRDLIRAAQLAVAGELVGGISHDLRQPLTALEINVEIARQMLKESPPDALNALSALDDAAADVRLLSESVQVLQDLVARREPRRTTLDVREVVREVTSLVQTEAAARRVLLEVDTLSELPVIHADQSMLREAILSLILGAMEHAAESEGRVGVSTRLVDHRVELTVTYGRSAETHEDEGWALSVARWVAEAHGATLVMHVDPMSQVTVRTLWPTPSDDVAIQM